MQLFVESIIPVKNLSCKNICHNLYSRHERPISRKTVRKTYIHASADDMVG